MVEFVVDQRLVFWTTGHVVGFIPRSTFHHDSSGSPEVEREVLYFQDFGLGPARESAVGGSVDVTWADIYDVLNGLGRWSHLRESPGWKFKDERFTADQIASAIRLLRAHGFSVPGGGSTLDSGEHSVSDWRNGGRQDGGQTHGSAS